MLISGNPEWRHLPYPEQQSSLQCQRETEYNICHLLDAQNIEGNLPSSDTVYCSIFSPQIYVRQRRCARGGNFVLGFININKYTSVYEYVHLCLRTVNWVTLVSLLVEYLLYPVLDANRDNIKAFLIGAQIRHHVCAKKTIKPKTYVDPLKSKFETPSTPKNIISCSASCIVQ